MQPTRLRLRGRGQSRGPLALGWRPNGENRASAAHSPAVELGKWYEVIALWSVPSSVHTWFCVSSSAGRLAAVTRVAECGLTWGGGP